MTTGYKGLDGTPVGGLGQVLTYLARVRTVVNGLLIGKQNVNLDIVLAANVATTTVQDPRIGGSSAFLFQPQTAHASAEIAGGAIWPSTPTAESVVINHANNAQTDRNFRLTIIG